MEHTRESRVPGNASRLFVLADEARQQPHGRISFGIDGATGLVQNLAHDASLIAYDDQYLTTCSSALDSDAIGTLTYWDEVLSWIGGGRITDIGCGQGEFVRALRARGHDAIGCDPAFRGECTEVLRRQLWDESLTADLYVMRCVLPHMSDPWEFLKRLASAGGRVLVEFQRREWIVEHGAWAQLSHDHVTLFSEADFRAAWDVVASGQFAHGEWGWVLLDPSGTRASPTGAPGAARTIEALDSVLRTRESRIAALSGASLNIWGAAGKGAVVAHALTSAGIQIHGALDLDARKHRLHLEGSGVEVLDPRKLDQRYPVLVCNPNHLTSAQGVLERVGTEISIV